MFSTIYYGSPVWLIPSLGAHLWKELYSVHNRALRLIVGDYKCKYHIWKLNKELKRGTLREWGRYSVASTVIKICRNRTPELLNEQLHTNMYFERRYPALAKFFDGSKRRVGKQALMNRLSHMNNLDERYLKNLSDNAIRVLLKNAFFNH